MPTSPPRLKLVTVALAAAAALVLSAPGTASAGHFDPGSSAACGPIQVNKTVCTLTILPDSDIEAGDTITSSIVSGNATFSSARYAGGTCAAGSTGGLIAGTTTPPPVSLTSPTSLSVTPAQEIEDCTMLIREVVTVTSPGQICQALDAPGNSPSFTVCATPTGSLSCSGVLGNLCPTVTAAKL